MTRPNPLPASFTLWERNPDGLSYIAYRFSCRLKQGIFRNRTLDRETMSAHQGRKAAAGLFNTSDVLMPSGSLRQFEKSLGYPLWFRGGTSLPPHPAAMPAMVTMADDLAILDNVVEHGQSTRIIERIVAPGRPPYSAGWAGTLALAPTAGDVIDLFVAELPRRNPYFQLNQHSDRHRTAITLSTGVQSPARTLLSVAPLALIYRAVNQLVGGAAGSDSVLELDLEYMSGIDASLSTAGLQLHWRAGRNSLSFPTSWLAHENDDGDAILWRIAKHRVQTSDRASHPLLHAVSTHIGEALANHKARPQLADIAAAVGLSKRTLVRRLAGLGYSFTQLVEQERYALALLLLADPDRTLHSIADRLGYPDSGRFGRAFRQWFGESPGRYRRELLSGRRDLA